MKENSEAFKENPLPTVASQSKIAKKRLDVLLVERGLAESRQRAQALILAGQTMVGGRRVDKAGTLIAADARIEIAGLGLRYVSRGGLKLEGALEDFGIDPSGKICLDAGSSTGGFTDCLLQHGALRVYAVDVSTNQLASKLREDPRVVLVERNARFLRPEDIGEAVELLTVDLSFISVSKVLDALAGVAQAGADFLILIKPQFELERKDVGRGGIVRDPQLHQRAIDHVQGAARTLGFAILGVRPSRLPGAEGNQEFFLHVRGGRMAASLTTL